MLDLCGDSNSCFSKDTLFERETAFYENHKVEFREKYLKKWLVIAGDTLIGAFDRPKDAMLAAQERHLQEGEFMLHRPADDDLVFDFGPMTAGDEQDMDIGSEMIVTPGEPVVFTYA